MHVLLVADNLQLTRPSLARELAARDAAALGARIKALVAAGAEAIDINTGPLGRQAEEQMVFGGGRHRPPPDNRFAQPGRDTRRPVPRCGQPDHYQRFFAGASPACEYPAAGS